MSAGQFVWRDLMTTDPEAAKTFYTQLFGWEITPTPMPGMPDQTYDMFGTNGDSFAGCVGLDPGHGIAPHWISYIEVPDTVDAAVERAVAKGGTVGVPPMDIPEVGRFAVVLDPSGSPFSPFTSAPGAELVADDGEPTPGRVSWNEVFVEDERTSVDFYTTVFGWTDAPMEAPNGSGTYHQLLSGGVPRAGLMATHGPMRPTWVIHFFTDDLEATTKKATDLGGSTEGPIVEVPGFGRFQWIADPQGATFVLGASPA